MTRKYAAIPMTLALLTLPLLPSCKKSEAPATTAEQVSAVAAPAEKADGATDKKKEDPNMKVAVVNDRVITAGELDKEFAPIATRLQKMGAPQEKMDEMRLMFLGKYIEREVLLQEAAKHNYQITDEQVQAEFDKFHGRFPDPEAFNNFLKESGTDEASLKNQLKQGLLIDKLIADEVESKVVIDDAAAKAYYDGNTDQFNHPEQLKASHILVKVDSDATADQKAEAKKKAEDLLGKVKAGGDFAALAKEFSACPSGQKGGDLGYFQKGQMVKPFEDACLALKPGEVSGIVETQFGFHIIKLVDHKAAGLTSFDEVKEELTKYLKSTEVQKQLKSFLDEAKKNAKVERFI